MTNNSLSNAHKFESSTLSFPNFQVFEVYISVVPPLPHYKPGEIMQAHIYNENPLKDVWHANIYTYVAATQSSQFQQWYYRSSTEETIQTY